jgi:Dockerin type I domain
VFTAGVCQSGGSAAPRFNDCLENFVGTDPLRACAATSTANDEAVDAMPADFNDDQKINVTDRTKMVLQLKAYTANNVTGYNKRYDLNADGAINVTDRTIVALYIQQTGGLPCTP